MKTIAWHSPFSSFLTANFTNESTLPFDQILLFGPIFNQLVGCIQGVIFVEFLQASEGKREVSEKPQTCATGKKQKKQWPVYVPLFSCIQHQTYPLMALLTSFSLAFAPASRLPSLACYAGYPVSMIWEWQRKWTYTNLEAFLAHS